MTRYETEQERRDLAACLRDIRANVEDCREKSLALTKLQEADFWLREIEDRQRAAEDAEIDSY